MENNKNIEIKLNSSYIAYSGDITVSFVDAEGRRRGKARIFKNAGRWPLFLFITTCLDGNFDVAKLMRPQYIELFHAANKGESIPNISDKDTSANLGKYINVNNLRTLVTYSFNEDNKVKVDPDGASKSSNLGSSSILYKFLIPFTHINTVDDINAICLYNSENYHKYTEPSMFFFVRDEDDTAKFGSLVDTSVISKNYNVVIEWKLTFKNETK